MTNYDEFGVNTNNSFNTPPKKLTKEEKIQQIANELDEIWNDRVFDILRDQSDVINSCTSIDEYVEIETEAIQRFAKSLLD